MFIDVDSGHIQAILTVYTPCCAEPLGVDNIAMHLEQSSQLYCPTIF